MKTRARKKERAAAVWNDDLGVEREKRGGTRARSRDRERRSKGLSRNGCRALSGGALSGQSGARLGALPMSLPVSQEGSR